VRLLLLTRDDDLRGGTHELCSVGFVLFSPTVGLYSILVALDRHRGRCEVARSPASRVERRAPGMRARVLKVEPPKFQRAVHAPARSIGYS